jgi:peptide methionine sulfoxide reductase MsrB
MQNLAYQLDLTPTEEILPPFTGELADQKFGDGERQTCVACGEHLIGADAESSSWQSWQVFWDALGMTSAELVCGACGEYLQNIFEDQH